MKTIVACQGCGGTWTPSEALKQCPTCVATPPAGAIQRYDMEIASYPLESDGDYVCPVASPNGSWVRYDDLATVVAERDALRVENERLKKEVEHWMYLHE